MTTNEYTELANAIIAGACDDYIEGFRKCFETYGTAFLKDGFAVKLPDVADVDVSRYAVAESGRKLTKAMCLYFDSRDFFNSEMFKAMCDIKPEVFLEKLNEKAKSACRNRRKKSTAKASAAKQAGSVNGAA